MKGQMDIFEAFPKKVDPPPKWDCMKTCARANIHTDYFPIRQYGKRCLYGLYQDGTTGKDVYEVIENNLVTHYCKYYKMKEQ
ncbi:MAG: hypothetical protein K6G81_01595 [Lachnospiraceae bacterium]|nr:hypothetical protein [Lachnospiraceae bacterium]